MFSIERECFIDSNQFRRFQFSRISLSIINVNRRLRFFLFETIFAIFFEFVFENFLFFRKRIRLFFRFFVKRSRLILRFFVFSETNNQKYKIELIRLQNEFQCLQQKLNEHFVRLQQTIEHFENDIRKKHESILKSFIEHFENDIKKKQKSILKSILRKKISDLRIQKNARNIVEFAQNDFLNSENEFEKISNDLKNMQQSQFNVQILSQHAVSIEKRRNEFRVAFTNN